MRFLLLVALLMAMTALTARAQDAPNVPNFWDAQERMLRPDVKDRPRLRFLTVTDFPPFSFIDGKKRLSGFHVELAREICRELELLPACQIQALPFHELESALTSGGGDAIMAGTPVTAAARERLAFSRPYFQLPGRFLARKDSGFREPLRTTLAGKTVGIAAGTAHAAYAQAKFANLRLRVFDSEEQAIAFLTKGEIDAVFSDALSLSLSLLRDGEKSCCTFVGGPYLSTDYFGLGLAIAVTKDDADLADAFDYALRSISEKGKFAELYLRYFPISLF